MKLSLAGKLVARRWRFVELKFTFIIDNNANFSTFEFVKTKFLIIADHSLCNLMLAKKLPVND